VFWHDSPAINTILTADFMHLNRYKPLWHFRIPGPVFTAGGASIVAGAV